MSKLLLISALFLVVQTDVAMAASDVVCQSKDHKLVIKFNGFDEDVQYDGLTFEFCKRDNPPNKPIDWSQFNCGNNRELKYIQFGVALVAGKATKVHFKFSHYHSPDDVDVTEDTMTCN